MQVSLRITAAVQGTMHYTGIVQCAVDVHDVLLIDVHDMCY